MGKCSACWPAQKEENDLEARGLVEKALSYHSKLAEMPLHHWGWGSKSGLNLRKRVC